MLLLKTKISKCKETQKLKAKNWQCNQQSIADLCHNTSHARIMLFGNRQHLTKNAVKSNQCRI
jgi:hypothetical protein